MRLQVFFISLITFSCCLLFLANERTVAQEATVAHPRGEGASKRSQPPAKQRAQLDPQARKTRESFRKINDHPLFEMYFYGDYVADTPRKVSAKPAKSNPSWACSLFVSYGADGSAMFGRNFDWHRKL